MIRLVELKDYLDIWEIYAHYVLNDSATFDLEVPSKEAIRKKITEISKIYPYYVYQENNKVVGYAYAHPYYGRGAYAWNVEISIYIHKDYLHQGIGTKLYESLFQTLKQLGYYKVYACITYQNQNSIKMHEKLGFQQIGYFKEAGYKFNTWWDMIWMEKALQPISKHAITPKSMRN